MRLGVALQRAVRASGLSASAGKAVWRAETCADMTPGLYVRASSKLQVSEDVKLIWVGDVQFL